MNSVFHIQPEQGQVVEISMRYGSCDFVIGYCRAILHAGDFVQLLKGFRRCSDPGLTATWSEPCDFDIQPWRRLSFALAPEASWMLEGKPGRTK